MLCSVASDQQYQNGGASLRGFSGSFDGGNEAQVPFFLLILQIIKSNVAVWALERWLCCDSAILDTLLTCMAIDLLTLKVALLFSPSNYYVSKFW